MTKDEALKLALKALDDLSHYADLCELFLKETHPGKAESLRKRVTNSIKAITAIKEALAQPEQNLNCKLTQARLATAWGYVKAKQKPVWRCNYCRDTGFGILGDVCQQLHNHRQRKPLTDKEIEAMWPLRPTDEIVAFARAIEAAHGIKENT